MESVKRAKQRMKNYPTLITRCSVSASKYAACVTRNFNISHNACENEFNEFKKCVMDAAKQKTK